MKIIGSVELEQAVVYLLEHANLEADDIRKIQVAKRSLIQDKKHTVMFVAPKQGSVSREARALSASDEVNMNAIGKAIVTPGLVARMVSNFFLYMNKPSIIHQVFDNETDAINWLKMITVKDQKLKAV